ncbi:MAG: 16S rRNA (cytidine(1402)-2'-O)-methyltransferase, partial [Bacteroidota bacterium]
RQTRLEFLATLENTVILYESPYRLIKTLQQIAQFMGGQRRVSVAKEISKMYEMHYRGTVEDALAYFTNLTVKGEFVIVVGKDSKLSEPTDNV